MAESSLQSNPSILNHGEGGPVHKALADAQSETHPLAQVRAHEHTHTTDIPGEKPRLTCVKEPRERTD